MKHGGESKVWSLIGRTNFLCPLGASIGARHIFCVHGFSPWRLEDLYLEDSEDDFTSCLS